MFSNVSPPPENHAVHGIMQNFIEWGRQQIPIWRTRIAYWISNVTNTHTEYVILHLFYTATVVARTPLNVTLYLQYSHVVDSRHAKDP